MEANIFEYLDFVRESGVINMMGASPLIMEEFSVEKREARGLLSSWMKSKR